MWFRFCLAHGEERQHYSRVPSNSSVFSINVILEKLMGKKNFHLSEEIALTVLGSSAILSLSPLMATATTNQPK